MRWTVTYQLAGGRKEACQYKSIEKHAADQIRPQVLMDLEYVERFVYNVARLVGFRVEASYEIVRNRHLSCKIVIGDTDMAGKGKIGDWKGFADIALAAKDKKEAKAYSEEGSRVLEDLENLVGSGYKITLSLDTRTDTHMCSISCYDSNSPNYKHTMVSRAKTAWGSLAVGLYKHWHVSSGVWGVEDDSEVDF